MSSSSKITENYTTALGIGYFVLMSLFVPSFFSFNNATNVIFNLIPLLIVAIGQTYVVLGSGIDLSVTSTIALTSVIGGYCMSKNSALVASENSAILLAIIFMLAVGALVGLINGLAIRNLKMPPFMVTLTTMMFFSGLAIWLTKSQNIYNLPEVFNDFPYKTILWLPIPLIMGFVIWIFSDFLLQKTLFGQWLYAIGLNPKVAFISGVKVNQTIVLTYVFSGITAAIASILYTARLETGSPVMGQNILLDVIGAVVIGGNSLFGGKGNLKNTFIGAVFIVILDNSLNLLGLSYFMIMIIKGSIILGASMMQYFKFKTA